MGLLQQVGEWRWYHLLAFWVSLVAASFVLLQVQSRFMREISVFLPYPNSVRNAVVMFRELGKASPLLLGELLVVAAIGVTVTVYWLLQRIPQSAATT